MRVVSHPEAEEELEAAALWYEDRQPGLGEAFLEEFERALRRVVAEPERWRKIRNENRKHNFGNFRTLSFTVSPRALFTSNASRTCIAGRSTGRAVGEF